MWFISIIRTLVFLQAHSLCLAHLHGISSLDIGESDFDALNRINSLDELHYKINWLGPYEQDKVLPVSGDQETLIVTTVNKEKYHCILPQNKPKAKKGDKEKKDFDLNPYHLLLPLFTKEFCSFRLEPYWSYELCHGRSIRQFHEESTTHKQINSQEYYLGKYDLSSMKESEIAYEEAEKAWRKGTKTRPTVLIDGVQTPYIEINMTGGTICDLNNKQRFTRVLYVCNEEARNALSSIKETYTCEYEAIVLTPLLCLHPDFRHDAVSEESIDCYSVGNSPGKPKGYSEYEEKNATDSIASSSFDLESSKLQFAVRDFYLSNDDNIKPENSFMTASAVESKLLRDFLNGDYCLHGGTDWWKYEFCYGNKAAQYHEEKGGKRSKILLGQWNLENHVDWLAANPSKKPKRHKTPKQVSHFYSNGDLCDLTGKPRQVEVKLKCRFVSSDPESVALYLMEPKSCEYVLGVESPLICHLLSTIDENGIMKHPED